MEERPHTIQQIRDGSSKDFWMHDPHMGRMHHRVESSRSILTARMIGKQLHFTEQIFNMRGYIQERVERESATQPVQHVRYIESREGLYCYSSHRFEAEDISFTLFRVPGTTLPLGLSPGEAFLRGVAEGASLSLYGRAPKFRARILRADVQKPEQLPPPKTVAESLSPINGLANLRNAHRVNLQAHSRNPTEGSGFQFLLDGQSQSQRDIPLAPGRH